MTRRVPVAVLIPCHNEETTIRAVIDDFRAVLPDAVIYVYDNNSTDRTAAVARDAGAVVRRERLQGKGYVIRRMFADIDAEFYVLIDGDATYEVAAAPAMLDLARREVLDMVNAARVTDRVAAYRRGHRLGNRVLTGMVTGIFGRRLTDMLSGYRVLSRRFVKSFPATSSGFEVETELTVHALALSMAIGEVPTRYVERPEGSVSKLRTYRDGFNILGVIVRLVELERPLLFFSVIGVCLFVLGLTTGVPVVMEYARTGLVPRLPSAVLATGLVILSALSFTGGLILDCVTVGRREMRRLAYLSCAAPDADDSVGASAVGASADQNPAEILPPMKRGVPGM